MSNVQTQTGFLKFTHEQAHARLTLWDDGSATVSGVYSRVRGKGHATEVLKSIAEYADLHGLILFLEVQRYGYKDNLSPDNKQLQEFYKKFDFEVVPDGGTPTLMVRQSHIVRMANEVSARLRNHSHVL